jgi:hypothetical protein
MVVVVTGAAVVGTAAPKTTTGAAVVVVAAVVGATVAVVGAAVAVVGGVHWQGPQLHMYDGHMLTPDASAAEFAAAAALDASGSGIFPAPADAADAAEAAEAADAPEGSMESGEEACWSGLLVSVGFCWDAGFC